MRTVVVNIRDCSRFDVYCGRASSCPEGFVGEGADGYFGNPFVISTTRAEAIDAFRVFHYERIKYDGEWVRRVLGLRGRVLGCWCIPMPCHVTDVLVVWLREQFERSI